MAPKKLVGAQTAEQAKAVFSTVERAFYDLQLADLNRKISRLKQAVDDYEIRNEELQKAYDTLDADRADVIAYIKKTLNVKNEENEELKEKVKGLEEMRELEIANFKRTVKELEDNFIKTKAQLTSENKLLAGKLNTLEEFRAIRDDLMQKYENNERAFEEQEMKYKRIIFDTEKKFIIGKDRLKKEMEERLLMLAQEFQDASELRIAASTHRVIRENIALNNQLDSLLLTQAKVAEQNEKYKEDERASRAAMEMAEEERDKAINKSMVQLKVIDQLTAVFEDTKKNQSVYDKKLYDQEKLQTKLQRLSKDHKNLLLQVRVLEQNLHATLSNQNKSTVEIAKLLRERETFKQVLKDSEFAVKASLKMDNWATLDSSRQIMEREVVLKKILEVINRYHVAAEAQSTDSLVSLSNIYDKGDLGFEVAKASPKMPLSAAGSGRKASLQSLEVDRSGASVSSSGASLKASLKTMPSIQLIPVDEGLRPSPKASIPSFTVTSLHSSVSSTVEEEEESEMANVSRMLAISKLEVQKSLMADLAMSNLSRISHRKISVSDAPNQKSSVAITEKKESAVNFEDEQHAKLPREDNEPTNDEPTNVEPAKKDEPTQGTDETVNRDVEEEKKEE